MKQVAYDSHTQIIFFKTGHKKTVKGVVEITEGEMTKLVTASGLEFYINKSEVEMVERYIPKKIKKRKTVSESFCY